MPPQNINNEQLKPPRVYTAEQRARHRDKERRKRRRRTALKNQPVDMDPLSNEGDNVRGSVAAVQAHVGEGGAILPEIDPGSTQTETVTTNAQPPAIPNEGVPETRTAQNTPARPAGNNSMLNLALGGNTFEVDVPAAIGREVLKIFNSTSWQNEKLTKERDTLEEENQTLWEKNKSITEKNTALVEENISLKLLLAQHGISLEELSEFGIPIPSLQLEPAPLEDASSSIHTPSPLPLSSQPTTSTLSSTHALDQGAPKSVVHASLPTVAEAPIVISTLEVVPQVGNTSARLTGNVSESIPLDEPAPIIGDNQDAGTITSKVKSEQLSSSTVPVFQDGQDIPNIKRKVNDENASPCNIDKKRQRLDRENRPHPKSKATERPALGERRVQSINSQDKLIDDDDTDAEMDILSESNSAVARKHPSKTQRQHNIKSSDEHSMKHADAKNFVKTESIYEDLEDILAQFMRKEGQNKIFCSIPLPVCGKGYFGAGGWRKHVDKYHPEWLDAQIKELRSGSSSNTKKVGHRLPSHQQEFFEAERQRERKRGIEVMVMELREELEDKGEDDVSIEVETGSLRRRLLEEFEAENESAQGSPHLPDSKLTRFRTDQIDRIRTALGVSKTSSEGHTRSTATSQDTRPPNSNDWKWDDDDDGNPEYHRLPQTEAVMRAPAAKSSNRDSMRGWALREPRLPYYDDPSEDALAAPDVLDYGDETPTEKKQESPTALFGGKVSFAFPKRSSI